MRKPVLESTENYFPSFLPHLIQKVEFSTNFVPQSSQNIAFGLDFGGACFFGADGLDGGGGCCTGGCLSLIHI